MADSRDAYRRVMADLKAQGAEAIILGCTEIALLVGQEDAEIPLFDTTRVHARSAKGDVQASASVPRSGLTNRRNTRRNRASMGRNTRG